ncbi:MAG: hypothetical protein J6R67_06785 [Treponema sp.]|nr:hypothetical protein [Treponema sp.]
MKQYTKMSIPNANLRTTMDCGIIKNMKSFAPIVALVGLLCCLFSCDTGKSGPFTFTNTTTETVSVLIDQDGVLAKTFTAGETYQGKDYYTPQITFVKGIDTAENKSIIDNRFTASSTNGFDYNFNQVTGTAINIMVNLPADFATQESSLKDAYLAEVAGKLGEFSTTTITLNSLSGEATESQDAAAQNYRLYTDTPDFRIYRDKTVDGKQEKEDISSLFTITLGKSEIPPEDAEAKPIPQWNLKITYPKVATVQN